MGQQVQFESGCPIVARSAAAGTAGGGLIAAFLFVIFASLLSPGRWAVTALGGLIVGAIFGVVIGTISGIVLAVAEQEGPRSTRQRRRTAFVTSALPFVLLSVVTLSEPAALLVVLGVAAVSGSAGAVLAPCVVRRPSA